MWYIIIFGLLTLSVAFDASRRKLGAAKTILWAIGTFLLGVIVVPIYLAKRPLKVNEVREGGLAWNLLKNFALTWTILMVGAIVLGFFLKNSAIVERGPTGPLAQEARVA